MKIQVQHNYSLPQEIVFIAEALKETDSTVYLVGGVLRDALLKITNPDIDIAVVGNAIKVGNTIAKIKPNIRAFQIRLIRWFICFGSQHILRQIWSFLGDFRRKSIFDVKYLLIRIFNSNIITG